ncbi:hypothetical protein BC828DRAFT_386571 [Blastocladiella britannica]|nr:hypothetical protein BC828DRAFT_386571 [Blastocladiella britannica]
MAAFQRYLPVAAGWVGGALSACGAAWAYSKANSNKTSVPSAGSSGGVPMPHTIVNPATGATTALSPRQAELARYGLPVTTQLQLKQNYVSLVDYRLREPAWVMEHLTPNNLKGGADRANTSFGVDHDIPSPFRSSNDDYLKSGYSRGHMAPAANNKATNESMKESFLLASNIVPQDLDNNMFYWNRMEQWVRALATKKGFDDVYILSGPLFLPSPVSPHGLAESSSHKKSHSTLALPPPADIHAPPLPAPTEPTTTMVPDRPFQYVSYKTIGSSRVAVPTHLFKAVLATKSQGNGKPPAVFHASFVVPNAPIREDVPLRAFQVPREVLESYAGFKVFDRAFASSLPVTDMCAIQDPKAQNGPEGRTMCQLENAAAFRFFGIERDVAKARNRADLERHWANAQRTADRYKMPVPQNIRDSYERQLRSVS